MNHTGGESAQCRMCKAACSIIRGCQSGVCSRRAGYLSGTPGYCRCTGCPSYSGVVAACRRNCRQRCLNRGNKCYPVGCRVGYRGRPVCECDGPPKCRRAADYYNNYNNYYNTFYNNRG